MEHFYWSRQLVCFLLGLESITIAYGSTCVSSALDKNFGAFAVAVGSLISLYLGASTAKAKLTEVK
jgi:hypothetical protein